MEGEVHTIYSGDVVQTDLGVSQYAKARGKSERQVRRWLADDALPGAYKDREGQWRIPATALERRDGDSGALVPRGAPQTALTAPVTAPDPLDALGHLVALDVAAQRLGTTVGGVRRMADDGLVQVGPWGPRGSLRVHLPS
jgi:hypothetical protein